MCGEPDVKQATLKFESYFVINTPELRLSPNQDQGNDGVPQRLFYGQVSDDRNQLHKSPFCDDYGNETATSDSIFKVPDFQVVCNDANERFLKIPNDDLSSSVYKTLKIEPRRSCSSKFPRERSNDGSISKARRLAIQKSGM